MDKKHNLKTIPLLLGALKAYKNKQELSDNKLDDTRVTGITVTFMHSLDDLKKANKEALQDIADEFFSLIKDYPELTQGLKEKYFKGL